MYAHWVKVAMDATLPALKTFASTEIKFLAEKTDRPRNEYWNSANVEARREIAMRENIVICHFSSQARHGKVSYWIQHIIYIIMVIYNGIYNQW